MPLFQSIRGIKLRFLWIWKAKEKLSVIPDSQFKTILMIYVTSDTEWCPRLAELMLGLSRVRDLRDTLPIETFVDISTNISTSLSILICMGLYNVAQEENISVNNYPGAISHLTPQFNEVGYVP